MLAIVEDEQQASAAKMLAQLIPPARMSRAADLERLGDGRFDLRRIRNRGKIDKPCPARHGCAQLTACLLREAGLSGAAEPCQRHQPRRQQPRSDLAQLLFPAD